jgi:hypothetical protein
MMAKENRKVKINNAIHSIIFREAGYSKMPIFFSYIYNN